MEISTKVSGIIIKPMATESTLTKRELDMKVTGKTISSMDREWSRGMKDRCMKELM